MILNKKARKKTQYGKAKLIYVIGSQNGGVAGRSTGWPGVWFLNLGAVEGVFSLENSPSIILRICALFCKNSVLQLKARRKGTTNTARLETTH